MKAFWLAIKPAGLTLCEIKDVGNLQGPFVGVNGSGVS